eukprot:SAG22_NODE_596_length_8727_cov_107.360338_1_plen_93_part_10
MTFHLQLLSREVVNRGDSCTQASEKVKLHAEAELELLLCGVMTAVEDAGLDLTEGDGRTGGGGGEGGGEKEAVDHLGGEEAPGARSATGGGLV